MKIPGGVLGLLEDLRPKELRWGNIGVLLFCHVRDALKRVRIAARSMERLGQFGFNHGP